MQVMRISRCRICVYLCLWTQNLFLLMFFCIEFYCHIQRNSVYDCWHLFVEILLRNGKKKAKNFVNPIKLVWKSLSKFIIILFEKFLWIAFIHPYQASLFLVFLLSELYPCPIFFIDFFHQWQAQFPLLQTTLNTNCIESLNIIFLHTILPIFPNSIFEY